MSDWEVRAWGNNVHFLFYSTVPALGWSVELDLSLFYTHTNTHTHSHTLNLCLLLFALILQIVFFIWSSQLLMQFSKQYLPSVKNTSFIWQLHVNLKKHSGGLMRVRCQSWHQTLFLGNEAPKLGLSNVPTLKPEVGEETHSVPL